MLISIAAGPADTATVDILDNDNSFPGADLQDTAVSEPEINALHVVTNDHLLEGHIG